MYTQILNTNSNVDITSYSLLIAGPVAGAGMTVYKSPTCGCCKGWVQHMRDNGFEVQAVDVDNVMPYKQRYGVPQSVMSCHTAIIAGYAIEGHVPAQEVQRLLRERPDIKGLAVSGMPAGSAGMGGTPVPYQVMSFDGQGRLAEYAQY